MNKEILPVLDEISAVLKKHDVAGLVMVANQNHCDWRMEVSPSWSCAWIEKDGEGKEMIRIRSKKEDYPTSEARNKTLEVTIGCFVTFGDSLDRLRSNINQLLVMISKHVKFIGMSRRED